MLTSFLVGSLAKCTGTLAVIAIAPGSASLIQLPPLRKVPVIIILLPTVNPFPNPYLIRLMFPID